MPTKNKPLKKLLAMLQHKRPHDSPSERAFIARYLDAVPGMKHDTFGNRYLRVGTSTTLFSAHTDTVHRAAGTQGLIHDATLEIVYKDDDEPLGADDGAGVWLLLEMINARVPGLYVFHRAEEIGGKGSTFIAAKAPELLTGINRAIAFDRKGTRDIITHQAGGRCCSDGFAKALAGELFMKHAPSSYGVFTDTANYTHKVPECTNVSVGYEREHTAHETLDLEYLFELREAVMEVAWEKLPTSRDPTAPDLDDYFGWGGSLYQDYSLTKGFTDDKSEELLELVYDYPEVAAQLLATLQPSSADIDAAFLACGVRRPR